MIDFDFAHLKSGQQGIAWPAIPTALGASMLAMQFQFQQSEWLTPEQLHELQLRQLKLLLGHALKTVPYYRERYANSGFSAGAALTLEQWQQLPVLERPAVQEAGDRLRSESIPQGHGRVFTVQTSGSTGRPVKVDKTEVTKFIFGAITLRDHLWHRRDTTAQYLAIRPELNLEPGKATMAKPWGSSVNAVFNSGQARQLSSRTDIEKQAAWLVKRKPAYLHSLPTNLVDLARYFIAHDLSLPGLREVRCYGEIVDEEVIELCHQAWGAKVTDMYSATEVGYIALQCPEQGHYHVQSEAILVEVLDDEGRPCAPGEVGKIVVTPLHNYAMPLIRYALGDHAEVGEPCACGRGLPVLKRILGRTRNMLTLPDGRRHYPSFPADLWTDIAPVRQYQLIQKDLESIKVKLVVGRPLQAAEEQALIAMLRDRLTYPFQVTFDYVDNIGRSRGGKFEDFISEVSVQATGADE
jgi:phenylacetate-CoA ligase